MIVCTILFAGHYPWTFWDARYNLDIQGNWILNVFSVLRNLLFQKD